ncbi:alkaline phosphatase [Maribacter sp. HTCC2170]|uniref:alkaline phosphatase n=1 Tax=Maribacter sp. (strain HTCC2170 / KCCM 42371) TaxID=313603 RepID=UPI00006BB12B|nr:alkaline phosphatase [Maribacter sp. HTCC2170]EAQ99612.1 alkaline phosphatase [Maribacter sp. HTCC2170]
MKFEKIVLTCLAITLFNCKSSQIGEKKAIAPKNVILLISDGTGLSQISSAFYFKDSSPNYARFSDIGLINTSSSREDVTDSAAGATAFACGVKTYNGAIGVADDSTTVKNLVEIVSKKNIKTGMIATSSITHATPASFFAHTFNRGSTEEIALHLTQSEVDFFAGGGLQFFNKRKDGRNLLEALKEKKFMIDTTALVDFSKIRTNQKAGFLLAADDMPPAAEGRGDFLSKATSLALQFLSKDDTGFFMMAEGSQIDWAGHQNNGPYLVSELIDFDDAIGKALDYAEKDGHTLVIVTSDHETGGFTLSAQIKKRADGTEYSDYSQVGMSFSNGGHSAALIPVFAFGPGSKEFIGVYENNDIFEKILKVTKWRGQD